jgi:hypothetical protein
MIEYYHNVSNTQRNLYRFKYTDEFMKSGELVLYYFEQQEREGKGKFKMLRKWPYGGSHAIGIRDVPLPDEVIEEVKSRFTYRLQVVKRMLPENS